MRADALLGLRAVREARLILAIEAFENMHRVLCIEGDESVRAMMRRLLEADGFAVEEAGTGIEGISRALALTPDLVVADTHLPDLAGPELTARLRQEESLRRVP